VEAATAATATAAAAAAAVGMECRTAVVERQLCCAVQHAAWKGTGDQGFGMLQKRTQLVVQLQPCVSQQSAAAWLLSNAYAVADALGAAVAVLNDHIALLCAAIVVAVQQQQEWRWARSLRQQRQWCVLLVVVHQSFLACGRCQTATSRCLGAAAAGKQGSQVHQLVAKPVQQQGQ
jgi:hypothetical protein